MRRPGLLGVLETVLYHESAEREAIECFYGDVLGLAAVARWEDGIAFRIGGGVLLLFGGDCLTGRNRRTALVELHAALAARRGRKLSSLSIGAEVVGAEPTLFEHINPQSFSRAVELEPEPV